MKVLLVNKFHYIKGGSETYYFGLGELLKSLGCDVIWFSMKDEKNRPCAQGEYFAEHVDFNDTGGPAATFMAASRMLYSVRNGKRFEQLLRKERPDIIHLNIFQSQLTGSIVDVARKYRIPIVYTAHDLKSVCPNYQMLAHGRVCEKCLHGKYWNCFRAGCMKDSRAKSLLAMLEAYVYRLGKTYRKIDLVITPSAFYKKKIEESGVFACPVIHMPNFLPKEIGGRSEAGDQSGRYFLYFGRLSREKGILELVEAYADAHVGRPLYIAGSGPMEEPVRELIKQKKMDGQIKVLGFKQGQELNDLVANAFCVCLPSKWYENGPYAVMEAQAAGKPVLVSNLGGLPELVEDGRTGYVTIEGQLSRMLQRMEEKEWHGGWDRSYIAESARKRYDAEAYGEKLMTRYRELLKNES